MAKFKVILKTLGAVLAGTVLLVAVAYGTPHLRANDCRALAIQYLEQHPVRGRALDQRWVSAKASDVSVYITGPFTSAATYFVPNDLHAIAYTHECKSGLFSASLGSRKRYFTL